jgi:HlyD family secretion protein
MKPTMRVRVAAAVGALAVLTVVVLVLRGRGDDGTIAASGTVETADADLGFQMPGRVEEILVREGDRVERDALLARLDTRELAARRRAAEAQRTAAAARLRELETGFRSEEIAQGRAALRAAERRLEDATRELARTQRLFDGGAVSEQVLEAHVTAATLAEAEAETARERLRILEQGPRSEQITAARSLVAQAAAAVEQLDAALEQAVIRAPFGGTVSVRHREPGETVGAGMPVLTLMNPDDRWVRIYVREDEVGRLQLGGAATITADAYPEREYLGEVVYISDEAEFTPRNVQTAQERVKLVYRVKVRITDDPAFDLKPGLPADVQIEAPAGA